MRSLLLICASLLLVTPAAAVTVTLPLDSAASSIDPEFAAAVPLSGVLSFEVGALPVVGNTTFDATSIDVSTGTGLDITLDPDVANPGLGVINAAGSFLIPNLFVQLDDGGTSNLTLVDVTGSVLFGPGGDTITQISTTFTVDSGGPDGVYTVTLLAVPEPSTLLLAAGGLATLALRARRNARGDR